jgi:cytochrome P450
MFGRQLSEDCKVGKFHVPKECSAIILAYMIHRGRNLLFFYLIFLVILILNYKIDEKYFKDPEAFIPERFLIENQENRHPFSYIPFSAGKRF